MNTVTLWILRQRASGVYELWQQGDLLSHVDWPGGFTTAMEYVAAQNALLLAQLDAQSAAASGKSTTLTAQANSGQKNLVVASIDGYNVGDAIFVGNSGSALAEAHVIASFGALTIVTTVNLANTHAIGTPVSRSPVELVMSRSIFASLPSRLGAAGLTLGSSFDFLATDIHTNGIYTDGRTLIAGTYATWPTGGKIWLSDDLGANWLNATPSPALGIEEAVCFCSPSPGVFVMSGSWPGGGSAIYRSTDSGRTWLNLVPSTGFPNDHGHILLALPNRVIMAATLGEITAGTARIYRSTDHGDQWTNVYNGTAGKTSIRQMVYIAKDTLVAGVYGAAPNQTEIVRSTDGGGTWAVVQTLASTDIYSMLALGDGIGLAGTFPDGKLYRTTDAGATWTLNSTYGAAGVSNITSITRIGRRVIMMTNEGAADRNAYMSDDNGLTWTPFGALSATYHVHMALAVDHETIVGIETQTAVTNRARRFRYRG